YVDDVQSMNIAHGYVLRSPHAHAKIKSIDRTAALAAPGVQCVLLGTDPEVASLGLQAPRMPRKQRDGSPMFVCPQPHLAKDTVRYVGDYVAFVVAETQYQAMDAADLVAVDYEPLPSVTRTADAMKSGMPAVWDECPNNIAFVHTGGDREKVAAAFAAAAHVVKEDLVINRVVAAAMEPRACVADYNRAEDHYTLYTTTQGAHNYRSGVAGKVLKVPESRVRVIAQDVGGSFGMKSAVYNENGLVLLASKVLGRPVKWTSTRAEAILSDSQGRDNVVTVELALDKDHRFTALRVTSVANLGCCLMQGTLNPPVNNIGGIAGVYKIPAICVDVTGVYTNSVPTRPYRGAGRPEASFMIERIIDAAADQTGVDPTELRRRNYIPPRELPYKTALTFNYDSGEFEKNMDLALKLADYAGFEERRRQARGRGKLRGFGLSNCIEKAASPGVEGAELRFDRGGTATLFAGSITTGQGHETVFKQIVCDRLGLRFADVHYVWGDTDKVAFGHGSGGSRSSALGSSAVLLATEKVIAKGRKIAAHALEVGPDDVTFADGVFSSPKSNKTLTIKDVAKLALNPKALPPDLEPGLLEQAVHVAKAANYPNGVHVCEIEVDEETGQAQMVNYCVVDDVGTVLNVNLVHGQVHGGIAQGAGQILKEDMAYDPDTGQPLTGTFMDYAMPRASDFPKMTVTCNPVPTRTNPLGVKGVGEAGTVGSMPAVANALADALSVLGIRNVPMPATPERLWRLMKDANSRKAAE
ncbi:MAG: molybdopterin-dependent oxidoreductase, partial [Alphaproteobacteria bacterium]|nr:molybdopterin-dependent oxidoreductase [Alphaproteobacteria bacterium]